MCNKCPRCNSNKIKKNGHAKNNKQQYHCNDCGGGFVENPFVNMISQSDKQKIEKALIERNSLRGICRIFNVSITWLLGFAVDLYNKIPINLGLDLPKDIDLDLEIKAITAEADELWSFVGNKTNKAWVWIVIDRKTRLIIAFHIGGRTKKDAKKLWENVPDIFKTNMKVYTDFLSSYKAAIPSYQHIPSGKDAGNTNHIERLNCTIRQRVSRLVRSSLSFSKKIENHIGAIKYFFYHYNMERQKAII